MQELTEAELATLEQMSESAKVPGWTRQCVYVGQLTQVQVDYANDAMRTVPVLIAEVRRLRAADVKRKAEAAWSTKWIPEIVGKHRPAWTVVSNLVSPENSGWIGTSHEFFDSEEEASRCYERHVSAGDCPTKRPFNFDEDVRHMGVAHVHFIKQEQT